MPLTEDESRRLEVIGGQLRRSDRRLYDLLSGCPHRTVNLRFAAMGTGLIATLLLVAGVALHFLLLCIVGWLCIVAWVVLRCIDGW